MSAKRPKPDMRRSRGARSTPTLLPCPAPLQCLTRRQAARANAAEPSVEHTHAVRTLIGTATGNSACVVLRALNSFVHGGLHTVQRVRGAFPVQLATQVLLNSNGMVRVAHRMMARPGSSARVVAAVERGWLGFEDCLPMA